MNDRLTEREKLTNSQVVWTEQKTRSKLKDFLLSAPSGQPHSSGAGRPGPGWDQPAPQGLQEPLAVNTGPRGALGGQVQAEGHLFLCVVAQSGPGPKMELNDKEVGREYDAFLEHFPTVFLEIPKAHLPRMTPPSAHWAQRCSAIPKSE